MQCLKIVISVERTKCKNLSGVKFISPTKVKVPFDVSWQTIAVRAHPSLTIVDKIDDKVRMFTSTLKFSTADDMTERDKFAYRVKLTDGTTRLIGTFERPYPVTLAQETMPEKETDNQMTDVTVTYTNARNLPIIEG